MAKKIIDGTPEITAIGIVHSALSELAPPAQLRVLRYCAEMLGLNLELGGLSVPPLNEHVRAEDTPGTIATLSATDDIASEDADGISPVALKWMRRSDLDPKNLQAFFSLGIDEIDLVARSIPGTSKKERMRSVLLLKGIAAYLSSGVPRVTYEQLKEACLHYDAYDSANFAANIRAFTADAGGTKEAGYTLTARGLTAATDILKNLLNSKS
jgi:hypothetical protein